jgi:glutathione S-transferase
MSELVLYTNPMSRGRIARWMLEEVGAPYRTEAIAFGPPMKSADYLAINPMGKVPAIRHGELVVTEVGAICAYLADAFPAAGLAPAVGDPERGVYYRWLFFAAGPLEQSATAKALGVVVPPERRGMVGYGDHPDVVNALDRVLSAQDYLAGGRFSAADVVLGSQLGWGMQFGTVEKRPSFEAYVARLYARPAHERATELDDALMTPEQRKMMGG